ncbi:hypothetical protein Cpin_0091 [Chitinophaga pinensis DSM 2588]|uniref:Uncharacterized protein n=1 Tax=Chitinophaga pinensis (strain ATCC 43595 / DSM 2588 / LMG 13176 / NBRC 15968 / NCIMB 11800 / UQM 2034) TaxID=485918 RepID=A0A979FYR7_CHIPD|nr:hypothetical protein Cpin_0091 [Chitinophaga pinensis DSM 2588]
MYYILCCVRLAAKKVISGDGLVVDLIKGPFEVVCTINACSQLHSQVKLYFELTKIFFKVDNAILK